MKYIDIPRMVRRNRSIMTTIIVSPESSSLNFISSFFIVFIYSVTMLDDRLSLAVGSQVSNEVT